MKRNMKQAAGRLWKDIKEYKWLGAVLVLYYIAVKRVFDAFCPLVIVTGFPCPGCGMTRALFFVLTGQFARAWNINPLIYGWILLALYIGIQRYVRGRKAVGWRTMLGVIALVMIGVYLYRMYRYFPNRAPMTFTGGSVMERLVPGYGKIIRKIIY